ncbi:nuclear transport factor 2 family protein [Rhodococcus sp. X156]|uniref:nuclear transport factor 2 family protein n=1 Tax=Rhodococcus sp. X156 TaxID=2499145 RepID=UPI000FD90C9A|nr:nuclear transport factor 2 family protein [Rhodococcus sp. X156]
MDLETLEEIKRLKYRYLRAVDTKDFDLLESTLTPDADAAYGHKLTFTGREEILAFMRKSLDRNSITEHHVGHPEIDVDGDTATGTWYLQDRVIVPKYKFILQGAAFYTDTYVRGEDGQWWISSTGYVRTYEATMSTDDVPSFALTVNRWADRK